MRVIHKNGACQPKLLAMYKPIGIRITWLTPNPICTKPTLGEESFRGKYFLKDSFITLEKTHNYPKDRSNKFVIGASQFDSLNERFEKPVFEIDNSGKKADKSLFKIIKD